MHNRLEKLRAILPDDKSAFLITSDTNRLYYSGFRSSAGAVFITKTSATLLVDFRYFEAAEKSVSDILEVVCYKRLADTLNELIDKENINCVIIEDDFVTVSNLRMLKSYLIAEIVSDFSLSDKILDFRMIKTDEEIEKVKTAQKITEKSYLELLNLIKVGVSEKELAFELEYLMKNNGAERVAFDLILISGKNTSLPHGVPSDKLLEEGDFITLDIGCVYEGYHSDMTRTVALHHATQDMREVYDTVYKAHLKASEYIKQGNTCADVDNAARNYITQCGYGEFFGHTTGHGVGLEIHEKPRVYLTDDTVLKNGMIITDEPGIYLPNKFGVRIEDMYLVTENGYDDIATLDKELIIL